MANGPSPCGEMGMSVATSVIAIGTASFVYLGSNHHPKFYDFGFMLLPYFLVINLFVDFVSLNKTRFLLLKSEGTNGLGLVGLLVLDLVLTVVLYSLPLSLFGVDFVLDVISGRVGKNGSCTQQSSNERQRREEIHS